MSSLQRCDCTDCPVWQTCDMKQREVCCYLSKIKLILEQVLELTSIGWYAALWAMQRLVPICLCLMYLYCILHLLPVSISCTCARVATDGRSTECHTLSEAVSVVCKWPCVCHRSSIHRSGMLFMRWGSDLTQCTVCWLACWVITLLVPTPRRCCLFALPSELMQLVGDAALATYQFALCVMESQHT
jgi:hypothetical protein